MEFSSQMLMEGLSRKASLRWQHAMLQFGVAGLDQPLWAFA